MPRRLATLLTGLVALGCTAAPCVAEDNLRCGNRLVSTGDSKDKVRAICGEPQDVSFAGVIRGPAYYDRGPYDYSWIGPTWLDQPVEIWTYNFGSHKLLRKLRFVGDELREIRTEGYGY